MEFKQPHERAALRAVTWSTKLKTRSLPPLKAGITTVTKSSAMDQTPTIIEIGTYLIDTANPKKCDFEFRFCQKCYKLPQKHKKQFFTTGKK